MRKKRGKLRLGVLFSGGKDSSLALYYAKKYGEIKCLISVFSLNKESYMFHTPNIKYVIKQADAMKLPCIIEETEGVKEQELENLKKAIKKAVAIYKIDGIVTGAIESIYQSSRIQKICNELGIECFNVLWQKPQYEILQEIVKLNFEVVITGVFAEGLDDFLGKKIDKNFIEAIKIVEKKFKINVAGEGGEFESFVLDAPFFKKRIEILQVHIEQDKSRGKTLVIDEVSLAKKLK